MLPNFDRGFLATYLRPERPRLALLAALLAASIAFQLTNPQLARVLVDGAQSGRPFDHLVRLAAAFLAVALATQIASVAETYVAEDIGWRTTNVLRADITGHVLDLDDSFHAEHGAGELIERIDGDVASIAGFFARFVVHVAGSALFLIGVLVLLWREDWRVGALLTSVSAIAVLFMTRRGGFVGKYARISRQTNAELSAYLEERLSGLPDIKANGADGYTLERLHERIAARFRDGRAAVFAASAFSNVINMVFVGGTVAALAVSALLHQRGSMTAGGVFLVFRYTGMLRMPLERLSRHMNSFQQATGSIARVQDLLRRQPRVVDGGSRNLPRGPLAVRFDDVSFAYEDDLVLRHLTWELEAGQVLGLLGRTGSGKTTCTRLLFRLHDVSGGAISLDGTDIRDVGLEQLRRAVALVTQDVQLFSATLRDNVTLFDPNVSDEQLRHAFEALDLAGWLAELPDGLDTLLGPTGRGLSAGEAQLVALARVFLRDPGLVVLDEASSRLDPHTEALLEHAVSRLLDGRTGIVIAHRLSTVHRADRILILDNGRAVEQGARVDLAADPASRFAQLSAAGLSEVLA